MRHSSRHGFTLVELLVVIAIIGVLVGLLLPAVQAAREAARRIECASRMGELAKATQQFELAKKRFPGYLEGFGVVSSTSQVKVGTWAVALLPYIEQEPTYDLWADSSYTDDWNSGNGFTSANAARQFYPNIGLFTCASDTVSDESFAKNSFVCNAGFYPDTAPPNYSSMSAEQVAQRPSAPQNGVFSNQLPARVRTFATGGNAVPVVSSRIATPTKAENIKDGLTSTIAFSENLQADGWGYCGNTINDDSAATAARLHMGFVWLYRAEPAISGINAVQKVNKINGAPAGTTKYAVGPVTFESARPSSGHTGVVNTAMLGGSVTTMSEGIDYRVYQALMTPHTRASDVPDKTYVLTESDYLN